MYTLSSSFLTKFPGLMNVSSLGNDQKNLRTKFTANSSFPAFPEKHMKKLMRCSQKLSLRQPPVENERRTKKQSLLTIIFNSKPDFVPREPDNPVAEEDDGYLVTYVHNENSEESWFLVMNAKSLTLDIVAKIRLPGRVPYGFHGLFVGERDLK